MKNGDRLLFSEGGRLSSVGRKVACPLFCLLVGPGCSVLSSPGAPSVDSGAISVLRHEIQLTIDPTSHRMRGLDRVTIQVGRREVREFSVTLNKALVVAWGPAKASSCRFTLARCRRPPSWIRGTHTRSWSGWTARPAPARP